MSTPLVTAVQLKAVIVIDQCVSRPEATRRVPWITALEHVANRSIIHHALDALTAAGVRDVIVTGEADTLLEIRPSVADYNGPPPDIEFVIRRDGSSLAGTLKAVAPLVGDCPCIVQPADGLLEAPVDSLFYALQEDPHCALLVTPRADENARGMRAAASGPTSFAAAMASRTDLGVFAPGALQQLSTAVGDLAGRAGAIFEHDLTAKRVQVSVRDIDGWCRYHGDRQDLLTLNRIALGRLVPNVPPAFRQSNQLEGRLYLDPTASIRDSVIIGPAAIGPGASVHEAYIGPYTSVGAGARVAGVEIERSIVAAHASVTYVSGRLAGSLVGSGARVFSDFSMPRALRLWVGEGDEVSLC